MKVIRSIPLGKPINRFFIFWTEIDYKGPCLYSLDVDLKEEIDEIFEFKVKLIMKELDCKHAMLYYTFAGGQMLVIKEYFR